MGLTSALHIGRSALNTSQIGLQVAGNNMANALTPGFKRQRVDLQAIPGGNAGSGAIAGRGVLLEDITRIVDTALQARIRSALSDENEAQTNQKYLNQIEIIQNEMSEEDISSALSEYFAAWSELANNPEENAMRALVIQQGVSLSSRLADLRQNYNAINDQLENELETNINQADIMLGQIAELNTSIVSAEKGIGTASTLRDQRDLLVDDLSKMLDITVINKTDGTVDILINSTPILLGSESRGVAFNSETRDGVATLNIRTKTDGTRIDINGGRIGSLLELRDETVSEVISDLDNLAGALIFETNKLHSQGQGQIGYEYVEGTYRVADTTVSLNDTDTDLPFTINNGSFVIHLTNEETGQRNSYRIDVDLDGVGTDMSLDDLVTAINAAGSTGMTAATTASGKLRIDAATGYTLSFSDDTSGALAGLGINTFFDGMNAYDISVNDTLLENDNYLAAGIDHIKGSNGNALAIAGLETTNSDSLNGMSIRDFWVNKIENLSMNLSTTNSRVEMMTVIRGGLESQEAAISGVSLDEEAVNMMNYQRQYEAAARFISVVDQMMQELMQII